MRRLGTLIAGMALIASACGGTDEPTTIQLITHESFLVSESVFEAFTAETGHTVELLAVGDAGTMVNQAILTKDNPIGDVMFGIDNTFLGRALAEDLFIEYRSPALSTVPDQLELDVHVTPISFGDVCLNIDIAGLADRGVAAPTSLSQLTEPAYAGLVAVEHPGTSSPGLAFMLATIAEFGEDGWLGFWADLRANDVSVSAGWEDAYYGEFSAYGGDRPIVVSYASSPPAEVIFADPPVTDAPTAVVEAGCYRQIEFAGILAGTDAEGPAKQLIDFMLGLVYQEDIPLNMFVFPANADAALPPEFVEHTSVPANPAAIDPQTIDANRERWIEAWIEVVTG